MVSLTRRQLLVNSGAFAAGCLLAAPSWATTVQAPPLRVWRYKGSAASFMDIAGQADTPYPVEWIDIGGGNLVLEALNSGALDYAFMSEIPPIFASIAKVPLALVAVFKGDNNDSGVVVRKDAGIRTVADLRGKKISYVRATNTHYFVLNMLRQNGMTLDDVQAIPLTMQDSLTAFRSGHLDAIAVGGISALQAVSEMDGVMLENVSRYYSGNYLIATTTGALADPQRRAQIGDFLQREKATWAWVEANPEAWAQRSAALTGLPIRLYTEQFQRRSQPAQLVAVDDQAIAAQQRVADAFYTNQLIRQPVDVRPLWNSEFNHLLNS
ncbi:ABC transporter substrate-binding protein [Pseudomonas sp.]|uniref:ABC transporter substrate-binding protein n=1 Tax=Pseudomonas sp. TaxID=306 RepID=UPI002624371C|nr:ABC transporter substrate-binding protein [Pseudomonas sp.]